MLSCLTMAKEKVQNLAEKLKLAKAKIVKLTQDITSKNSLLNQYQNVNKTLCSRIKDLENEIFSLQQMTPEPNFPSTAEIKKMIEESLSEAEYSSDQSFYKDKEVVSLRKTLEQLRNDDKFRYFIKLNDLDPVKILSMPQSEESKSLSRSATRDRLEPYSDPLPEPTDLSLPDYVKFSYIICRLLECEEKHR